MMGTAAGGELKKPETNIKFVEDMTAEERAKDRAAKQTGRSAQSFKYNPITNSVKNF